MIEPENDINENYSDIKISNHEDYILDPLSVIVKLAIIGNKPIGTKIFISNNVIYLQEPGPFQGLCRYIFNTNKSSIHFLYNPIQIACEQYMTKDALAKTPKLINLFKCAQNGILKLIETYKTSSIIKLCLNYFYVIIDNYTNKIYNQYIFRRDSMTSFYNVEKINPIWTEDKIKFVLDTIDFLMSDSNPTNYVKSLETIMENIDKTK
jgi:hypothetical protein